MSAKVQQAREEMIVTIFGQEGNDSMPHPGEGSWPQATAWVDKGYKIVGGGACVRTPTGGDFLKENGGNFLYASYPVKENGRSGWRAKSKDHFQYDKAKIDVYAIAIYDPNDDWEVAIEEAQTGSNSRNTATLSLSDEYLLTGGGARVEFEGGVGQLLTASYPEEDKRSWTGVSRSHLQDVNGTLHVYAIGIKPNRGQRPPESELFRVRSSGETNWAEPSVPKEYTLVGGGALIEDSGGAGQLLLTSYPYVVSDPDPSKSFAYWIAESKWHRGQGTANLWAYAIGIKKTHE